MAYKYTSGIEKKSQSNSAVRYPSQSNCVEMACVDSLIFNYRAKYSDFMKDIVKDLLNHIMLTQLYIYIFLSHDGKILTM